MSSVVGGLLAGKIFTEIWQRVNPSDQEPPDPEGPEPVDAGSLYRRGAPGVDRRTGSCGSRPWAGEGVQGADQRRSALDAQPASWRRCARWLTRNVRVLSAVSFLQDTASELLYPLLPIYLTSVLGAPAAVVGAVEGAAEGAASLTKLAAGPARRPVRAPPADRHRLRDGRPGQGDGGSGHGVVGRAGGPSGGPARQGHSWCAPGRASGRRHRRGRARTGVRIPPRDGHFRRGGRAVARPGGLRAAGRADRTAAVGGGGTRRAERRAGVPGAGASAATEQGRSTRGVLQGQGTAAQLLAGDGCRGRVRVGELPRRVAVAAAQRDRLLGESR